MKCLLVANIFPPINGGSAVVYESLCQFSPAGSMMVLAPWRHYLTGEVVDGWQEYDAQALSGLSASNCCVRPSRTQGRCCIPRGCTSPSICR